MKSSISMVALVASLMGGSAALAAAPDAPPPPPASNSAPAPALPPTSVAPKAEAAGPDDVSKARASDRAAFFDAHLAALRAGLTLTKEQDTLWPPLERAFRDVSSMRMAAARDAKPMSPADPGETGETRHEGGPGDPISQLKTTSDRLLLQGRTLGALADAATPFYASLSDEQKRRLPVLLGDLDLRGGPVGRMVAALSRDTDRPDAGSEEAGGSEPRGGHRHDGAGMEGDRGPRADHDGLRRGWPGQGYGWRDGRDDGPDQRYERYSDRSDSWFRDRDDGWDGRGWRSHHQPRDREDQQDD